ncbi:GNAT family N-acetyltransferase [Actinacidiphila glaucinigra]|uniref:GNAT family N-acetyltransferase n=1 Tax=Actinacidiphila glaucinigra TaxID=235986 RepID=UPI00386FF4E0
MSTLRIERPHGDAMLEDWRFVHNTVIPTGPLSLDDVRERSRRNHLEVAYLGDAVVGCTTVRPPTGEDATATVIARVLPGHREQGFGTALYTRGMDRAREMGAAAVETIVLASNSEGLRFAGARGFVEVERYVLPGDTIAYVTLRLP